MEQHLHIVTHEIPWPVEHGGLFDLFYKIKALHQKGIKIHLHCFSWKKTNTPFLENYCSSIHYYKRKRNFSSLLWGIPYIVGSRNDQTLIDTLLKDNYPIIFEGIHTTYPLFTNALNQRPIYVRLHNVEWKYYLNLFYAEKKFFKKIYYKIESILLKRFEKKLAPHCKYWAVSEDDSVYYKKYFNPLSIEFIPVFIPWNHIQSNDYLGQFCLYHGNLSISENEKVATWLINDIFQDISVPLVIAGKNPSKKLIALAHQHKNICLAENPSDFELEDLIKKAQINILPSLNDTGVKLKIINALFNGKHCIININADTGIGVKGLCICITEKSTLKEQIKIHYKLPFSSEQKMAREQLCILYNNDRNAEKIIKCLY